MAGTPNTTEQMIALIIQGNLDPQRLNELFDAEDYLAVLRVCTEPQGYIDGLYKIFDDLPLDSPVRPRCFRALRRGGGDLGVLPTCYHSPLSFEIQGGLATASGGFADVWKADGPPGVTSALKVLRITKEDNFKEIKKRFCKEVLIAKLVNDDNVLAIDGVQMIDESRLCIISKWMEHGNMYAYIEKNQNVNRVELLLGVIRGLGYLHAVGVVHGDLKSNNILIDSNRKPRLTDFGLSSVTKNISFNASTERGGGTIRWKAPELLSLSIDATDRDNVESVRPTEQSDVYSLAMVVIEIFTGKHPFALYRDEQVILRLARDMRPEKPTHEQFTSKIWSLTNKCWNKDPSERPNVSEVLHKLESGKGNNPFVSLPASLSAFFGSRLSLQFGGKSDTDRLG